MMRARVAIAIGFDRREIILIHPTLQAIRAVKRLGCAITGQARRQNAIEQVNAARDELHHLRRSPKAHGVAGFGVW